MNIEISKAIWEEIQANVRTRLRTRLTKPIVFALYTLENNHRKVTGYREIPTVRVSGSYPDGDFEYTYPGIKAMGFYPPKGTGRWFSGTLVFGAGIDLNEKDKKWMIREQLYFRIKIDTNNKGEWEQRAYCVDFPIAAVELK